MRSYISRNTFDAQLKTFVINPGKILKDVQVVCDSITDRFFLALGPKTK